jgi:pimeloyl-ACP methyl ester carboxylesterase
MTHFFVTRPLLALAALGAALAPPAAAQQSPIYPDPQGYCVASNTHHDPSDVRRPDAPPIELPPGFTRRRITVAGFSTSIIEAGPRDASEAIVFLHGNPGSSLDFLGLLRAAPPGTRVVALDILGFGAASKPYDFPYDFQAGRPLIDRILRELGITRMHLVGHDVGSVVGVDWAARHPDRLASAVLIAGGILIGYQDHHFARAWKTPLAGEEFMRGTDREGFVTVLQAHNPRPLPREFVDRNYDSFDRGTRCAILKLYRAMPDLTALGREHAKALRPHDRPALVIWGDRDPFLPQYLARSNREGFPSADIRIFSSSGHWPFVDEERRTVDLMRSFLARHVGVRGHGSCAAPSGRIIGRRLGPAALGWRRSTNRRRFPRHSAPRRSIDRFCLRGGGAIRLGYPSRGLNRGLAPRHRSRIRGRAILALASSRRYALRGVRAGDSARHMRRRIRGERRFGVGVNNWFLARGRRATLVFKVRRGRVREVGIADRRLSATRRMSSRFLRSFR